MKGKTALVTGGAGFIASHLVDALLRSHNQVIVLDDLSTGTLQNLRSRSRQLKIIRGDVRDAELVKQIARKSDFIFHLAEFIPNTKQVGSGHVIKFSMDNPFVDLDICVRGTLNVLEAAKEANARVLFTSTAAVYGNSVGKPFKETTAVNPISPYGASKSAAETYCRLYANVHGLDVKIVRLFNVFGPRQRKYIMYDILSKLQKNPGILKMLGSGKEVRDFIYVGDVVRTMLFLSSQTEYSGEVFNVGTGIPTSTDEVARDITHLLNVEPQMEYTGSSWKGDINYLVADVSKLRAAGIAPRYSIRSGLQKLIDWFQQQGSQNHEP
jgi:UDP-glucose 4-epimerase